MARGYTPAEIQREAARIRERVRSGDMDLEQATRWLQPLGVRLNGEPIVTETPKPKPQSRFDFDIDTEDPALTAAIRARRPREEIQPRPVDTVSIPGGPLSPRANQFNLPEQQGPPDPMAGLRGPPGPEPEGIPPMPQQQQQGPPDPMAGLRGPPGPEPMGIPPMPPMTPGVPGGQPQQGFFPPQGSWGDTMVDQQRAKVARDAARNPPPQSPYNPLPGNNQPPGPGAGPPNPFAGIGDLFSGPTSEQIAEAMAPSGVAPAPGQPQGPAMMPGGPPRPPQPRPQTEAQFGMLPNGPREWSLGIQDPSGAASRLPNARPEPPASTLDVAREAARQALRERDDMDARINRDDLGADPGGFTAAAAERARQAQRVEPAASMQQSAAPGLDPAREAARRTLQLHPDTGRIRTAPGFQQYEELARQPRIERNLFTGQPLVLASPFTPGLPRPRPENSSEEQAVRQTTLGVPLPGDLIAGPASPVEAMGSDVPSPYYRSERVKDDYIGDEEDEEDEVSQSIAPALLASDVGATTGTYDGGGDSGVSPPPGIPEPEEPLPAIRLQPLVREEYVLPESSRNSQAFLGLGNREKRPVRHVVIDPAVDGPASPFQKFGEPRSGSGFGRIAGGIIGGLAGLAGGGGIIGGGLGAYGGQKLGRKIGGWLGDRETGAFSRVTNPNYRRDKAQEEADIAANEWEKKYHTPFPGTAAAAGVVPITRVIEEHDLPPPEEEEGLDVVMIAEAQQQRQQREAKARDSLARDGGGTRVGGLFGSGSGGGNYGYSGNYPGWGGYGGGYGPDSIGGGYRNR